MTLATRNLARLVWIHVKERDGDDGKRDVLSKLFAHSPNPHLLQDLREHAHGLSNRH